MADERRGRLVIELTGDNREALRAIREVLKELEKLRDKTITVTVKVKQDQLRDLGKLADLTARASRAADDHARASSRAAAAAREHARANRENARAMRDEGEGAERAASGLRAAGDAHSGVGVGARSARVENARSAASMGVVATSAGRVTASVGQASDALRDYGQSARYAVREMSSANRGLRSAYAEFERFAARGAGGGGGGFPPVGGRGGGLGFGDDGEGLDNWSRAATRATNAGAGLNRMLLTGAGYGVLGGVIVGGVAELGAMALGVGAVVHAVSQSPAAMTAAKGALREFTDGMKESRAELNAGAIPAFQQAKGAMRGLGQEWGQLGATVAPTAIGAAADMARAAAPAIDRLTPSIDRAVHAGGTLGSALINAVGNSGPALDGMSNSIERNADGIGKLVEVAISAGGAITSGALDVAGGMGNVLMPDANTHAGRTNKAVSDFMNSDTMRWLGAAGSWAAGSVGDLMSPDTAGGPGWSTRQQQRNAAYNAEAGAIKAGTLSEYDAAQAATVGVGGVPVAFNPDYKGPGQGKAPLPGQQVFHPVGTPGSYTGPVNLPPDKEAAAQLRAATEASQRVPSLGQVGPGQGVGNAAALQNLAAQYGATGVAAQQYGSTTANALNQAGSAVGAGPRVAQSVGQAQESMMSAASVIPSAAQSAFQPINAAAQAVQPAPAVGAGVSQAVRTVTDYSGAMGDAGAGLGGAVTSGAAAGITQTQEVTITVVRKFTKRVVEEGKDGLDAHSPSRKFEDLGKWAGQGLSKGMGAQETKIGVAAGRMVDKGTDMATPKGEHGEPVDYSKPGEGFSGATAYSPPRGGGQVGKPSSFGPPMAEGEGGPGAGDRPVPPGLAARGFSDETNQRVMDRLDKNQQYWADKRAQASENKEAALYRALVGPDAAIPGDIGMQAELWRATGRKTPGQEETIRSGRPALPDNAGNIAGTPPIYDPNNALLEEGDPGALRPLRGQLNKMGVRVGQAVPDGLAQGVHEGQPVVQRAGSAQARALIAEMKRKLGISSPSRVTAGLAVDTARGFGAGRAEGIASNTGLKLGYVYGKSIGVGVGQEAYRVINKEMIKATARPDIGSNQAERWLGLTGNYGAAGSGAAIWKNVTATTAGGGGGEIHNHMHLRVDLEGQPFRELVATMQNAGYNQLADVYQGARG